MSKLQIIECTLLSNPLRPETMPYATALEKTHCNAIQMFFLRENKSAKGIRIPDRQGSLLTGGISPLRCAKIPQSKRSGALFKNI